MSDTIERPAASSTPPSASHRTAPIYDSRTETPAHTTAARIGKQYEHGGAVSDNPNKSSTRTDDGVVTSHEYGEQARSVRGDGKRSRMPDQARRDIDADYVDLDYHHPIEDVLATRPMRALLRFISRPRRGRNTLMEEIVECYGEPNLPLLQRLKLKPFHFLIDRLFLKGTVSAETFRQRIAEHKPTIRGLVWIAFAMKSARSSAPPISFRLFVRNFFSATRRLMCPRSVAISEEFNRPASSR